MDRGLVGLLGLTLDGRTPFSRDRLEGVTSEIVAGPPPPAVPTVPDVGDASTDPLDEFDSFARQLPARVGVAVVPVGGGQALTGGEYLSEVAWSTIKVPLAMAALAVDPAQIDNATAALTVSDNSAAQAMWGALGSDTAAAEAVQQVLASYGDVSTVVQQEVVRPGFSAFGQTLWPLVDQARFAAAMLCRDDTAPVLSLMGQVSPGQSWGLGQLPRARVKGGWGPDESGEYTVRQFGIVDTGSGHVAVAVAAIHDSGTFDDGVAVLNEVATWLEPRLAALTVASECSQSDQPTQ